MQAQVYLIIREGGGGVVLPTLYGHVNILGYHITPAGCSSLELFTMMDTAIAYYNINAEHESLFIQ